MYRVVRWSKRCAGRGLARGCYSEALERSRRGRAFPDPCDKAAAVCESIIRRHPFVDGNKRTAVSAAAYLLERQGIQLTATSTELEDFAVEVAEAHKPTPEMARWFEEHTEKVSEH